MKKLLISLLLTVAMLIGAITQPALAEEIGNGARIFEVNCAGCHPKGGNIIRRGKTLKLGALKKYKMDSIEAIASIVANGKNPMTAFKDRLTEKEINEVAAYVLAQAEKDWK